jgi:hypothetical protein
VSAGQAGKNNTQQRILLGGGALLATGVLAVVLVLNYLGRSENVFPYLSDGVLEGADYWANEPLILSAGLGFDNIIGISDITKEAVIEAGGSWYGSLKCTSGAAPGDTQRTSAAAASAVGLTFKGYADYDDGLPIVFSWPVATETVDLTDFKFTLNTGEVVVPHAAGMVPNWERNERNTVVVFGDFGNRLPSSDPGTLYPVKLEIVADATPLHLIGPDARPFNAVGMTWETQKAPYDAGPVLVGAKLNHVGTAAVGEGGVTLLEQGGSLPNDEFALYGGGDFRLRVLTSGGFSPDGVTGLRPDMFEQFFRLHVKGPDGNPLILDKAGVDYDVAGGRLRIVGLSDLGQAQDSSNGIYYDDCYTEDRDNYIDIILVGDEQAARNITHVEIPGLEGGYRAFYNPGGPGPEPTDGVTYTAPGPADLEPVIIALDNPMRVSRQP